MGRLPKDPRKVGKELVHVNSSRLSITPFNEMLQHVGIAQIDSKLYNVIASELSDYLGKIKFYRF